MLEKIISGGQTGAEQAGLYAAEALGLRTGGTAPPEFMTEAGPNLGLLRDQFGLEEGRPDSRTYPKRTVADVRNSDGTAWFGYSFTASRELTYSAIRKEGKPRLDNPTSEALRLWVEKYNIEVLNVAGTRTSRAAEVFGRTLAVVYLAFRGLRPADVRRLLLLKVLSGCSPDTLVDSILQDFKVVLKGGPNGRT